MSTEIYILSVTCNSLTGLIASVFSAPIKKNKTAQIFAWIIKSVT